MSRCASHILAVVGTCAKYLVIDLPSILQHHDLTTGIGLFLDAFQCYLIHFCQQFLIHLIVCQHHLSLFGRCYIHPCVHREEGAYAGRESACGSCLAIEDVGHMGLYGCIGDMSQYHCIRGMHSVRQLFHALAHSEEGRHYRHLVLIVGKEVLIA